MPTPNSHRVSSSQSSEEFSKSQPPWKGEISSYRGSGRPPARQHHTFFFSSAPSSYPRLQGQEDEKIMLKSKGQFQPQLLHRNPCLEVFIVSSPHPRIPHPASHQDFRSTTLQRPFTRSVSLARWSWTSQISDAVHSSLYPGNMAGGGRRREQVQEGPFALTYKLPQSSIHT